jgi:uncharacterized protein YecT (DUF1311 family)
MGGRWLGSGGYVFVWGTVCRFLPNPFWSRLIKKLLRKELFYFLSDCLFVGECMKKGLLFFVLMGISSAAYSADVECSGRAECWPDGSAMSVGFWAVERRDRLEALLEDKHEELVKLVSQASSVYQGAELKVSSELIGALNKQYSAWLFYRSEECALIAALKGAGGSWPSTHTVICQGNHVDQRLRRVRSSIRCINKIPVENRLHRQERCLQQLAPLANKL